MLSRLKENIEITLILLAGFIIRLATALNHSYTNDELSAINRLRYDSFSDLIEFGVKQGDMHPAGVQVFEKIWSSLFGTSEFALKFPFVLFGTISIWLVYKICLKWVNKSTGIIASLFIALLNFPIIQSELARPYSIGLLISLVIAHFLLKILFEENKKWTWSIFLGLSFSAAMYTHYFLFLFILFIGFSSLFFLNKKSFNFFFVAVLIGCILYIPHIPITLYHLGVGGLGWLGKPSVYFLPEFLFHLFNESFLLITYLIILIILSFIFATKIDAQNKKTVLLFGIWFFGIYLVGHILSIVSTPLIKFPVFIFATPFLIILISVFISQFKFQKPMLIITTLLLIYTTLFSNGLFDEKHHGFRKTAELISSWNEKYGEENIVSVYNINNPNYINFYANKLGDTLSFDVDEINYGDEHDIREKLMKSEASYCIVGFAEKNTVIQIFEIAKELYPFVVDRHHFENSTIYLLSKNETTNLNKGSKQTIVSEFKSSNFENSDWKFDQSRLQTLDSNSNEVAYILVDDFIYGPEFIFQPKEFINDYRKTYFKVQAEILSNSVNQLTITVSAEKNGELVKDLNGENFWMGFDVDQMISCQAICSTCIKPCYFAFELPAFVPNDANVKISFWNRGNNKVGIKSVSILKIDNEWN